MSTNNGTNPTPLYAWLVGQKERLEADIAARKAELEEVEVAMAALAHRQAPPLAQQTERAECRHCSGPIARQPGQQWVHDRDGGVACKPGHSGPLAEPLEPTGAFPAVQPGDATQVIPAVEDGHFSVGPTPEAQALWGEARLGSTVAAHWKHGGHITGVVRAKFDDRLIVHDGEAVYDLNPADIARVEPADLDTPTTTPAQDGGQG